MKALRVILVAGLSLIGLVGPTSAQRYREPDDYDYEYRQRDYDYRDRYNDQDRYGYGERGPRYRERANVFSEREYLRCHPDVRQAVRRGDFESGYEHYQRYGRREGRTLSC